MYKSLSPTLTALNIDFYNDVACTSCTNASWEVVASKNPDDCQRFETGHHSNYDKLKKAIGEDCILCCWCMIKHCYASYDTKRHFHDGRRKRSRCRQQCA